MQAFCLFEVLAFKVQPKGISMIEILRRNCSFRRCPNVQLCRWVVDREVTELE